ncbi:MAG: minor capsid protein [Dysgonamonadaceae bacterium]|nr:minor capsid protein [Dysgonamonadaceae bacterium]
MRPETQARPLYADICPHCKSVHPHAESLPEDYLNAIQKEFEAVLKRLYNGDKSDNKLLSTQGKLLTDRIAESYREINIDYSTPDAEMLMRLTRDTWQFSAAKNYHELRDLTLALKDENGKLREWSDFKETADKTGLKYNELWMRTEYDQAIAGAQNAARWTEFEREKDVIPNLRYQTVGDNIVRPEHQLLHGIIKPIDDPFWATHYPPNGWGCRCEALQSLDGDGSVTPDESIPHVPIAPMFRTNLAKSGLIYPKNHPYYNGIPRAELRKAIAYLPPENTYQSIIIGKHEIDVHPLHGEKELGKNLDAVNTLLKFEPKAKIKLLPIIEVNAKTEASDKVARKLFYPKEYLENFSGRNADMLLNGKIAEIEVPKGTKSSIQNAIKKGKKQADWVLVRIPDTVELSDAGHIANGQMKHYSDREDFSVWIYNSSGKIEYKTKQKR